MSEDRTQPPSKRRRQQARDRGHVARSPELTAAVGLLAGLALLGVFGDDLVRGLTALVRDSWRGDLIGPGPGSATELVDRLRQSALGVIVPLGGILGGVLVAITAAHQAQVGGLFVPGLLAPDPQRLWRGGPGLGEGVRERGGQGAWSLAKAAVVVVVSYWGIRSHLPAFLQLGRLDARALAHASGGIIRDLGLSVAAATTILGLLDFFLRYRSLEEQLSLTPDENREEQRAVEGDPALRARRRRVAHSRRSAPTEAEALAEAALVVTGPEGLAVVLGGGPPPRRVSIRLSARGRAGESIRIAARRAKVPTVDAPALSAELARGRAADPALLAAVWPKPKPEASA